MPCMRIIRLTSVQLNLTILIMLSYIAWAGLGSFTTYKIALGSGASIIFRARLVFHCFAINCAVSLKLKGAEWYKSAFEKAFPARL